MTSFRLPPTDRDALRAALRKHADTWIQRFYRHELLVARAVRGVQTDLSAEFMRTVARPVVERVAAGMATFDRRGQDIIVDQEPELRRMLAEVERLVKQAVSGLQKAAQSKIGELVRQEVDWVQESAQKTLKVVQTRPVSLPAIERAVEQRPYLGGKTEEWFSGLVGGDNGVVDNVKFAVQTGVQRGLSTDEIARTLNGTKAGNYQDGLLGQNDNQVKAMVRTAASHASATARMETFKALGVDSYQFVATLDSRTSIQCAANDGKVFRLDEGGPMPPLHPNCRSTVIPWTGDEPIGNRASVDGPVPAGLDFRQWLEDQPVGVQDEVLGRTRAAAWRAGDLSFDQMVGRDLLPLSITELRDRDLIPNEEE